jgi:hypothetical protein
MLRIILIGDLADFAGALPKARSLGKDEFLIGAPFVSLRTVA